MDATATLVSLLPVVVGGVIGLVGGLGGQWLSHGLQAKAEKKRRRAAKFEEAVGAIYEFDHWLDAMINSKVFGEEEPKNMSALPKAAAICSLYFPEFKLQVLELQVAAGEYRSWSVDAAQKRLQTGESTIDGSKEAYQKYALARHALVKVLEEVAQGELQ